MTYCVTCRHDTCTAPSLANASVMVWPAEQVVLPDPSGEWWAWLYGPRDQTPPAWWGRSRDRGAA